LDQPIKTAQSFTHLTNRELSHLALRPKCAASGLNVAHGFQKNISSACTHASAPIFDQPTKRNRKPRLRMGVCLGLFVVMMRAIDYIASLQFSPGLVARRFKGAVWLAFPTEGRAGVVETTLSSPTEGKPSRACHWAVAAEAW
jgi:hypothetical protein